MGRDVTKPGRVERLFAYLTIVVVIYGAVALFRYRLKHPDKTETELMLEIPEALLWE